MKNPKTAKETLYKSLVYTCSCKPKPKRKILGDCGEHLSLKAFQRAGYIVENLNKTERNNYPYADLVARKNRTRLAVSVKTRNRRRKDGEINSSYNLTMGKRGVKKLKNAINDLNAEAFWAVVPIDFKKWTYSVYFGSWKSLGVKKDGKTRNAVPMSENPSKQIGECLVKQRPLPSVVKKALAGYLTAS